MLGGMRVDIQGMVKRMHVRSLRGMSSACTGSAHPLTPYVGTGTRYMGGHADNCNHWSSVYKKYKRGRVRKRKREESMGTGDSGLGLLPRSCYQKNYRASKKLISTAVVAAESREVPGSVEQVTVSSTVQSHGVAAVESGTQLVHQSTTSISSNSTTPHLPSHAHTQDSSVVSHTAVSSNVLVNEDSGSRDASGRRRKITLRKRSEQLINVGIIILRR